jgi:hypothetical protein
MVSTLGCSCCDSQIGHRWVCCAAVTARCTRCKFTRLTTHFAGAPQPPPFASPHNPGFHILDFCIWLVRCSDCLVLLCRMPHPCIVVKHIRKHSIPQSFDLIAIMNICLLMNFPWPWCARWGVCLSCITRTRLRSWTTPSIRVRHGIGDLSGRCRNRTGWGFLQSDGSIVFVFNLCVGRNRQRM